MYPSNVDVLDIDFGQDLIIRKTNDLISKLPLKYNWDLTDPSYQIHHDEQRLHKHNIDKIHIDFKENKIEYHYNNKHAFFYDLPIYLKNHYLVWIFFSDL